MERMVATSNLTCSPCAGPVQYNCVSLSLLPIPTPLPFFIPLSLPHSALLSVLPSLYPPPFSLFSLWVSRSPGWPQTHHASENELEPLILLALPVCAVLRSQACAIRPGLFGAGDGTQGFVSTGQTGCRLICLQPDWEEDAQLRLRDRGLWRRKPWAKDVNRVTNMPRPWFYHITSNRNKCQHCQYLLGLPGF